MSLARRHALVQAMKARKRTRRVARTRMPEPRAARLEYHVKLKSVVRAMRKAIEEHLIPELALYAAHDDHATHTDSRGLWADARMPPGLRRVMDRIRKAGLDVVGSGEMRSIARQVAAHSAGTLATVLRVRSLNILGGEGPVPELVDAFVTANVGLIEGLVRDVAGKVERLVIEAATEGLRVETLTDLVRERLDVGESRAALIARDQVLKLNGDVNRARQTAIGITHYFWKTSHDERVRPIHAELDGTRQSWDDPPVINDEGETGHPGDDYQCRCVAVPDVSELIDDSAA